jgi:hypothetical protein
MVQISTVYRHLRAQGGLRGQQAEPGGAGAEGGVLRPPAEPGRQALTRGVRDERVSTRDMYTILGAGGTCPRRRNRPK